MLQRGKSDGHLLQVGKAAQRSVLRNAVAAQVGKASQGAASRKCLSNCLDESIAAQSAKLNSLALIPEVNPSSKEGAYGCSAE
ncbi:hypothetical protein [Calothrix sp. NIES-2098]|uniref:hypothetical protein n=1 Tax=Calothrix sp. NIES-2098 TaxID=1954171 RepID=UPI0030D8A6E9